MKFLLLIVILTLSIQNVFAASKTMRVRLDLGSLIQTPIYLQFQEDPFTNDLETFKDSKNRLSGLKLEKAYVGADDEFFHDDVDILPSNNMYVDFDRSRVLAFRAPFSHSDRESMVKIGELKQKNGEYVLTDINLKYFTLHLPDEGFATSICLIPQDKCEWYGSGRTNNSK